METFQIPRGKVSQYFGSARSTLYRWLHKIEDQEPSGTPVNKTPVEIASLVWEITKANLSWGRIRISDFNCYLLRTSCMYIRTSTSICLDNSRGKPENRPRIKQLNGRL
jgi:hypothetical protein